MSAWIPLALLFLLASPPSSPAPPTKIALDEVLDEQALAADAGLDALLSSVHDDALASDLSAPDLDSIASAPAAFRGQLFHLTTGPATCVAERAFDIDGLSAWQTTSTAIAEPILLLVYEPNALPSPDAPNPAAHIASIELDAAFWKSAMADLRPQDTALQHDADGNGHPRRILVFVGSDPRYVPLPGKRIDPRMGLLAVLVAGGGMLLAIRRWARPQRQGRSGSTLDVGAERWNDAELPDEPAEALAELRRRSEDTMMHE